MNKDQISEITDLVIKLQKIFEDIKKKEVTIEYVFYDPNAGIIDIEYSNGYSSEVVLDWENAMSKYECRDIETNMTKGSVAIYYRVSE